MSIELETLDQLAGGDLTVAVVRGLYATDHDFCRSLHALLRENDVRLLDASGMEVPEWQWRELFVQRGVIERISEYRLSLTERGARKI